jgi:hypothetical protein
MYSRVLRHVPASLLVLATLCGAPAHAQDPPELKSLMPSPTPAFLLLGVSPSSVSRPNNPADLATELANGTGNFSALPQNLAVEVAPYWMVHGAGLSWREDVRRKPWQSITRTLAFSAASAEIGNDSAPRTALGFGGRTLLLSGRVSPASVAALEAREGILAGISGNAANLMAPAMLPIDDEQRTVTLAAVQGLDRSNPRRQVIVDSIADVYNARRTLARDSVLASAGWARIEKQLDSLQNLVIVRTGPMLEIAGAASWAFQGREWDTGGLDRVGLWATYSCEQCGSLTASTRLTPMLVARFLRNVEGEDTNIFDAGGRLAMSGQAFSFSLESVVRTEFGDDNRALWRVVGNVEYELTGNTWLQASFGRDHDSPRSGDLVAQFGVKFNLIRDRYEPGTQRPTVP